MEYNNMIDDFLKKHRDPEVDEFVEISLDFIDEIHSILEEKEMSQKDLAVKMGKTSAEISKWLSGNHNITFKSLAKLRVALNADIMMTETKARRKFYNTTIKQKTQVLTIIHSSIKNLNEKYKKEDVNIIDGDEMKYCYGY